MAKSVGSSCMLFVCMDLQEQAALWFKDGLNTPACMQVCMNGQGLSQSKSIEPASFASSSNSHSSIK